LAGPIVAGIYATVIYNQRKWLRRNTLVAGRTDESTKNFLAAQTKTTIMLTKLVIVYCLLVSRIHIIRFLFIRVKSLLFETVSSMASGPRCNIFLNETRNRKIDARKTCAPTSIWSFGTQDGKN
jgi:hypothetical protein